MIFVHILFQEQIESPVELKDDVTLGMSFPSQLYPSSPESKTSPAHLPPSSSRSQSLSLSSELAGHGDVGWAIGQLGLKASLWMQDGGTQPGCDSPPSTGGGGVR